MRKLLIPLLLALTGCAGSQSLRPHMEQDLANLLKQHGYGIDVQTNPEQLVQGDVSLDAQKMLDTGSNASMPLYATTQGAALGGPGTSVAGAMLGSMLVNHLNKSRSQSEAEKVAAAQVAPLRQATADQALDQWFERALQAELDKSSLARPAHSENSPYRFRFTPQAELGQALDSTLLITEISLSFGRQVLYQSRIEVLSSAAWSFDSTADIGLQPWLADDAEAYKQALLANLREMLRILALDLETQHFASMNSPEKTLRYAVGNSRFVERGRLIAEDGQRALFMDLRGWLKSVPLQAKQ